MTENPCEKCHMQDRCRRECYGKRQYHEIHRRELKAAEAAERKRKEFKK